MQKPMSPQELELELAKARQMAAAGKGQEALVMALNLLQHALGQLRHGLLALHCNLTQLKEGLPEERDLQTRTSADFPGRSRNGRTYH